MKKLFERLLLCAIVCVLACLLLAPARGADPNGYYWRIEPGAEAAGLFQGLRQIGCWTPGGGYQALIGADTWGEATEPPCRLPGFLGYGCRKERDGTLNYGVQAEKLGKTRYTINGQPVSRDEAIEALKGPRQAEAPNLPDDSQKKRLTIIGQPAARKQVEGDLAGPLAAQAGSYAVQSYDPQNWAVSRYKFVTSGNPTTYLQDPSGRVLARRDTYPGAAQLGKDLQAAAMRNPDPNYDPARDPTTPGGSDSPAGGSNPAVHWTFGLSSLAAIVAALWRSR